VARLMRFLQVLDVNSRPRKCLNYATPYEVFKELTGIDAIILVKGIRL